MTVIIAATAVVGVTMLLQSHAATRPLSAEAESGARSGNALLNPTTAGASGNSSIRFGSETQVNIPAIDTAVNSFMNRYAVPGMQIAITRDDRLVYAKSYGRVGLSDNTPLTNKNIFRIASISKFITGVGILKLIEDNKLTMDSKVFGSNGVLGKDYPNAPTATHDITVRNLLQHTTGVWGNEPVNTDPTTQHQTYDHKQLIDYVLANYPADTGRGNFVYSNFGYMLLGRIIEKLSSKSYEQYTKDVVLAPSGVTGMSISGNTLADRKPNEVLYNDQYGNSPYTENIKRLDANGGWLASAIDYARYMVHVDGFPGKQDILTPASINTLATPSAVANYSAGVYVNPDGSWGHNGSLYGSSTLFVRNNEGFNWVLLTNTRSNNDSYFGSLDELIWQFVKDPAIPWQDIDQF